MSYQEIVAMPFGAFQKFCQHLPKIRAEEMRSKITVNSYPHLKKKDQRKVTSRLDQVTEKEKEVGSVKDLQKHIAIARQKK